MTNHQYFAHIDENNVVLEVAVVHQDFLEANPERYPGTWVETFYDLVNEYQSRNQDKSKRLIDFYEMAHFRLKTNRFNSK